MINYEIISYENGNKREGEKWAFISALYKNQFRIDKKP